MLEPSTVMPMGAANVRPGVLAALEDGDNELPMALRHALAEMLDRNPEDVVRKAVKGMLPHKRLGAQQLRKPKIYAGSEHPHQDQPPEPPA